MQNNSEQEIIEAAKSATELRNPQLGLTSKIFWTKSNLSLLIGSSPCLLPTQDLTRFPEMQSNHTMRVNFCLTYRHSLGEVGKETMELTAEQWKSIIQKTFDAAYLDHFLRR
jgi:hypothetical protein